MTKGEKLDTELLAAFIEGEVPQSEAAQLAHALEDDPGARKRLDQLRHVKASLEATVPEVEHLDLTARVHAAIERGDRPAQPSRRLFALGAGMLAVAASLVMFFTSGAEPSELPEFRAKSAGGQAARNDRWAGIHLYRAQPDGELAAIPESIRASDGLLVSYTNLGPRPYRALMVFAIDADRQVRWFYPAYERAGDDPASVAIEARSEVSLGEVVEHEYAPGLLTVHALFTRTPWRVSEVERYVTEHGGRFEGADVGDGVLQTLHVKVTP